MATINNEWQVSALGEHTALDSIAEGNEAYSAAKENMQRMPCVEWPCFAYTCSSHLQVVVVRGGPGIIASAPYQSSLGTPRSHLRTVPMKTAARARRPLELSPT